MKEIDVVEFRANLMAVGRLLKTIKGATPEEESKVEMCALLLLRIVGDLGR